MAEDTMLHPPLNNLDDEKSTSQVHPHMANNAEEDMYEIECILHEAETADGIRYVVEWAKYPIEE
jgi:hypothetical protein